jgi:hypothetical protein
MTSKTFISNFVTKIDKKNNMRLGEKTLVYNKKRLQPNKCNGRNIVRNIYLIFVKVMATITVA